MSGKALFVDWSAARRLLRVYRPKLVAKDRRVTRSLISVSIKLCRAAASACRLGLVGCNSVIIQKHKELLLHM